MCIFGSVFKWLDEKTKEVSRILTVDQLAKRVTQELHRMICDDELPIVVKFRFTISIFSFYLNYLVTYCFCFREDLLKDLQHITRNSKSLLKMWDTNYEGLGIGDYFIVAIEKFLKVGICVSTLTKELAKKRKKSEELSFTSARYITC